LELPERAAGNAPRRGKTQPGNRGGDDDVRPTVIALISLKVGGGTTRKIPTRIPTESIHREWPARRRDIISAAASSALGRNVLVGEQLRSGRLVLRFALRAAHEFAYYILTPLGASERPEVGIFANSLLTAAQDAA
jgi:hypothetical protein